MVSSSSYEHFCLVNGSMINMQDMVGMGSSRVTDFPVINGTDVPRNHVLVQEQFQHAPMRILAKVSIR